MTRLVVLLMLVATTAETQPAQSSVTLRFVGPKVGDTWKEESSTNSVVTLVEHGQQVPFTSENTEHKVIEVVAVNGNAVTKAKITYTAYRNASKRGASHSRRPGPFIGKQYTLTAGLPTRIEAESSISESEADLVREREKRFGTDDRSARALNGRTFVVGKPVTLSGKDLAGFSDEGLVKWTLTFRGMSGADAQFDMTMRVESDRNGQRIAVDLAGKGVIDPKTAMLLDSTLQGTITLTGGSVGQGTMTQRWRMIR